MVRKISVKPAKQRKRNQVSDRKGVIYYCDIIKTRNYLILSGGVSHSSVLFILSSFGVNL